MRDKISTEIVLGSALRSGPEAKPSSEWIRNLGVYEQIYSRYDMEIYEQDILKIQAKDIRAGYELMSDISRSVMEIFKRSRAGYGMRMIDLVKIWQYLDQIKYARYRSNL